MQTFLPYADFERSAAVLDDQRLGKQRVEAFQILRALTWTTYGWKNHPAVRMWRGFVPALVCYGLAVTDEWIGRGRADTVRPQLLEFTDGLAPSLSRLGDRGQLPLWLGLPALHASHQSALVRKDPAHYREHFPSVPPDLPYVWPPAAFPRWPVRRPADPSLAEALRALGYAEPRPGQEAAVAGLVAGRDVLLSLPSGAGGSATGLLASLLRPSPTLWVAPPGHPLAAPRAALSRRSELTRPAEQLPPAVDEPAYEYLFLSADRLAEPAVQQQVAAAAPGLVVVDDAHLLALEAVAGVLAIARAAGSPPVLVVTNDASGTGARTWQASLADPLAIGS